MRLKNVKECLLFRAIKTNVKGEYTTTWRYIDVVYLSCQQDINEIDRNEAGEIDFEIVKFRTDKIFDIRKGDGLSFTGNDYITIDDEALLYNSHLLRIKDGITTDKPSYLVKSCPRIGTTTLYTCKTNTGE